MFKWMLKTIKNNKITGIIIISVVIIFVLITIILPNSQYTITEQASERTNEINYDEMQEEDIKNKIEFEQKTFPFPPPKPSAAADLLSYFTVNTSLQTINEILCEALENNGYFQRSYYYAPGGFAIVTQLEHIDEEAYSLPEPNRWTVTNIKKEQFSLADYLKALFTANPGFYRCIVFLITEDLYSFSDETLNSEEISNIMDEGFVSLPHYFEMIELTDHHSFQALIYEFKKNENDNKPLFLSSSSYSGNTHLERTGILNEIIK